MDRPVIVALDLDNEEQLNKILSKLGDPHDVFVKVGMPVAHNGGIMLAQSYALSASHAFGIIYFRFAFCVQMYGIVSAMFYADVGKDQFYFR